MRAIALLWFLARRGGLGFLLAFCGAPAVLHAATCAVPTVSHPTLGAAIRDASCATIDLAAGVYPENVEIARSLAVSGVGSSSTQSAGRWSLAGAATEVTLAGLRLDGTAAGVAGCWPSLLVATGGARVVATDDVVVANSGIANGACRIFTDGFESGGTLAWSASSP